MSIEDIFALFTAQQKAAVEAAIAHLPPVHLLAEAEKKAVKRIALGFLLSFQSGPDPFFASGLSLLWEDD